MKTKMAYEEKTEQESIPTRARNINQLEPVESVTGKITSSNKVSVMKKAGQGQSAEKFYFFKTHSPSSRIAELEAYCGSICQFLAGPEYVPSTRPWFDDNGLAVGVSSKLIEGFESNLNNPLKPCDTRIDSVCINIEHCERIIKAFAQQLIEIYNQEIGESLRSAPYAFLEDSYHAWFDTEATIYFAKTCLLEFLNSDEPFSDTSLNTLHNQLTKRSNELSKNENASELYLVSQIKRAIQVLNELHQNENPDNISIEIFEKLDKANKNKGIKIYASYDLISEEIDGCYYTISQMDLHNYRILRGQAVSLTTSYIFKNGDDNNTNRSKKGQFFDFDWAKANILMDFKEQSDFNELFRRPTESSFSCDEYNIQYFPDVNDPTLFYWPTKQPEVHKLISDYMSNFLQNIEERLFNELAKEENKPPLVNMLKIIINFSELMESLNPNPVSKTNYENATDLFSGAFIRLKAISEGRSAQELIDDEQIKYLFTRLHQLIIEIKAEVSEWASQIDKNNLKELIKSINEQFDDTVLAKIQKLKSVFDNLNDVMQDLLTMVAQHPMIRQSDNPLFDKDYIDYLFEGLNSLFLKIQEETSRAKVIIETNFNSFQRNAYSLEDNQVYKSLSLNPVFIFHKYKTFMKYILTDEHIYRTFARLNIGSERCTDSNRLDYNLHKKLVKDELLRIAEIHNTLISMSDFKEFLEEHGNFAFELLKEEFLCANTKYQKKTIDRPIYNQLVQALNIDLIESRFNELCSDCDLDYLIDQDKASWDI